MTKPPRAPRSKPLLRDDGGPLQSRPIRKRDRDQPRLLFDPLPSTIDIALAALKAKPPSGPEWSWEVKWDGYRLTAIIGPDGIKLMTRGGYDWADRFPSILQAARDLGPTSMILDGEAVVLDQQGRSDFGALQRSLGADGRRSGNLVSPAILMAFDILYLDGHDLRAMDYGERRHLLEDTVGGLDGAIRLSQAIDADPAALLQSACELGLEGIVGKHMDRPYRGGRTGDWIKCKCVQSEAFFIIGYEPSTSSRDGFGSLLLAAYRGHDLAYVGSVGTGFKEVEAGRLKGLMDKLAWKRKQPPVPYGGKRAVTWVQPTLIAEIEFRAWTDDGKLRHAAYKGLREFQDNADVYRLGNESET